MIPFAIIGAGWRSEFFLRIAEALPDLFHVTAMVIRDATKAAAFEKRWGVKSFRTVDELLQYRDFSFAVVSVPRTVAPAMTLQLTNQGVSVLCETPPAKDLNDLVALHHALPTHARVQVAEQYLFQPNHAARLYVAESGKLGTVTQAQLSVAHDYHGVSLIRQFLGVGFEDAVIRADSFISPITEGPSFDGLPKKAEIRESKQVVATLRFGEKLGVYDFTEDQYFSWIRSPRVLIRGDKGEINNFQVKYLKDFSSPVDLELRRTHAGHDGNLEGYYLKEILLGDEYVYKNAFVPGRLTDDEIAIATSLVNMYIYTDGGPSFYSLAEASQDHYLSLMILRAAETGEAMKTTRQPWAMG